MLFTLTKTRLAQSAFILIFITLQLLNMSTNDYGNWISIIAESVTFVLNVCLLVLIGGQLRRVHKSYAPTKIFISLLIIHCFLQFFYVVVGEIFQPGITTSWLMPQLSSKLTAACLLSLLLVSVCNRSRIELPLIVILTLGIFIAGFIYPDMNVPIYFLPCTLAGFYLFNWSDTSSKLQRLLQQLLAPPLPLWFYLALIISGFIAIALPQQIQLSTTEFTIYTMSFLLSLTCVLFAASPFAYHVANWWLGWVGFIAGLRIEHHSPVVQSSTEISHSYQIFTYIQHSLLRLVLITVAAIALVELPFRSWEINDLVRWMENSTYFLAISVAVIISIYFIVRSFLRRTAAAFFTIILMAIISVINYLKMQYLGVPFMPTDFHMAN